MAALASRLLWPASVAVRTFTGGSGRVYTYAKILDVLAADVAAGTTAGLINMGQSGAVPALGMGAAGEVTVPPQNPPGGQAQFPSGLPNPDPNRPAASSVSAGALYFDAALQRPLVSDAQGWFDAMTGAFISA